MSAQASAAIDLLARQMWITEALDSGEDGVEAATSWDEDQLLSSTYERFERFAQEAVRGKLSEASSSQGGYTDE